MDVATATEAPLGGAPQLVWGSSFGDGGYHAAFNSKTFDTVLAARNEEMWTTYTRETLSSFVPAPKFPGMSSLVGRVVGRVWNGALGLGGRAAGAAMAMGRSAVSRVASWVTPAAKGTGAFLEGVPGGEGLGWLTGKSLNVSSKGIGIVEGHLAQFGDVPQNTAMIGRLRTALVEGRQISGADASFYMHEISEATMMGRGMSYEAAHAGALERYGVSAYSVYHPSVIKQFSSNFNSNWEKFWGL